MICICLVYIGLLAFAGCFTANTPVHDSMTAAPVQRDSKVLMFCTSSGPALTCMETSQATGKTDHPCGSPIDPLGLMIRVNDMNTGSGAQQRAVGAVPADGGREPVRGAQGGRVQMVHRQPPGRPDPEDQLAGEGSSRMNFISESR